MPSDDFRGEPAKGALPGFDTYADDTPRDGEPGFRAREPRSWGASERSLVVAPPPAQHWFEPEAPPERRRRWLAAAAAAAVAVAFLGGVLIARTGGAPPAAQVEAAAPPMNVEVAAVKPPPIPSVASVGKLEVLPRDSEPRRAPSPPLSAPAIALPAPQPPTVEMAQAATGRDASVVADAPTRRSFACADAPSRARQMVCADMGLAALDRRMKQAYAAAISAGAAPEALAADQDDWLNVREEAARRSRWAVASVYRQRIDELWEVADRAPR